MLVTTRKSVNDDWGPAVKLDIWSGTVHGATLSPDNSTLYLEAYKSWGGYGSGDYWQVNFIQDIDFKDDGIVDFDDLLILIDNWGTSKSLCDIAPMPLCDGFVNKSDLQEFINQWIEDDTFIVHYKFDEIDGIVAHDSTGGHNADIIDDPNWHPEGGTIDGAIELDGIDDYISTPFILNPRETSEFSIFAWIKGGLPGEVILSQANGANWLSTNAEGHLMTELKGGRGACDLISDVVITDGDWHRVGFTWDGDYRILYVDDVIAAIDDTQNALPSSEAGLYIGTGNNLEPGTLWTGMIDDVRIYNRVITP
jgi:hypothetical protein